MATAGRGRQVQDKDNMSAFKRGDRVLVSGGTYKYHHVKFIKNAGAFSARMVLESTGEEKSIQRHNLRIFLQQQRLLQPQERNTAATSGVTSTSTSTSTTGTTSDDSIEVEDLTRSEVTSATAAATAPSRHHQERWRGTGHTDEENSEEDLAAAVLELSQIVLVNFSLLMAQLGVLTDRLNRSMSNDC
jgi:hypothetical protein